MVRIGFLVFLCAVGAGIAPCRAASFDCAAAKQPQDKTICGNPDLSDLDSQMAALYRKALLKLSPSGADQLKASQRSWLHYIRIVCPSAPFGSPQNPAPSNPDASRIVARQREPVSCLSKQYRERLGELAQAGQTVGPYMFNRIDLFAAKPSDDDTGGSTGFYVSHTAFPQIDTPRTAVETEWNRKMVRALVTTGDCGDGDYDMGYELGKVTQSLISLMEFDGTYCHGTPHGFGGSHAQNLILASTLRPLTASDVFGAGGAWKQKLQALLWKNLLDSGWQPIPGHSYEYQRRFSGQRPLVFLQ